MTRKGKLAIAAHRLGSQAFGRAPRAQRAAEQAAALQRRAEHIATDAIVPRVNAGSLAIPPSRDELETDLKNRRATLRQDKKAARDLAQASGTQLRLWETREGVKQRDRLVHDIPFLAPSALAMTRSDAKLCNNVGLDPAMCCPSSSHFGMLKKQESQPMLCALEKSWEDKHNCTFHHLLPTLLDAKPNKTRKPSCIDAGVCLCFRRVQ